MQQKDPSENILTTRQVSDLVEELVGTRPTADQIREWCRQGYVAPEELPPIHLEHVRNRQGHYEITEESVRRFVEMRRRRETNLLAFVKWCRQRSAELQSKGNKESAASPPESSDAADDDPAPEATEDSIATDSAFAGDLNESDTRSEPMSATQTVALDDDTSQPPEFEPEKTIEPEIAQPIMADAADAFADDLLSQLVVEETGEDIEDEFFSTFIEDDQGELDSDEFESVGNEDDATRESSDSEVLSAVSDAVVNKSFETELPETDSAQVELSQPGPPAAESPKAELSQDEPAIVPVDDFGSFDEPSDRREQQKRVRRGFRSRRSRRSSQTLQRSGASALESDTGSPDSVQGHQADDDPFSFGIFESTDEKQESACVVEDVTDKKSSDYEFSPVTSKPRAGDILDVTASIEQEESLVHESPVIEPAADRPAIGGPVPFAEVIAQPAPAAEPIPQPAPIAEPVAESPAPAFKPTPTHPVAPTLSLPPIKPLPANSPLLPNFGAPRVSSPLRPDAQNQKPIAKSSHNQTTKAHPPRRTNAPAARRAKTNQSAQLDQLAAAYAAFASGMAPAIAEPVVEPESRRSATKPSKSSPSLKAPTTIEARRDLDQESQTLDRMVDDHAISADTATSLALNSQSTSPTTDNELESHPLREAQPDRPRRAAQVSRYLWLWVTAIAIGWACFGVSFVVKDDFGVIALSSIAVAATGMSGLWWTGK